MSANAFFEPLETRRMLSASFQNGIVRVHGTDGNDLIAITQDASRVRINDNGTLRTFPLAGVKQIIVNAYDGNDRIRGLPDLTRRLTIRGGPGRDTLVGGSGNDQLFGEAGEDTLNGGKGSDVLSGGADIDDVTYADRSDDLIITLDDLANDGAPGELDNVRTDIEVVITGGGNDRVIGSAAPDAIDTGNGSDTVYGMGGNDRIFASNFPDGTSLDRVYGGDGDDWIRAQYGAVIAYGDQGNDTILGSDRADRLDGGAGADSLSSHGGDDRIDGGDDDDILHGWGGNDTIRGGAGNDWISGDTGHDLIWGDFDPAALSSIGVTPRVPVPTSEPVPTFSLTGGMISSGVIRGPITIGGGSSGGGGIIVAKPIDLGIVSKVNFDTIFGGDGNDTLHGGNGSDRLFGDNDNDHLFGDAGNDDFIGGAGNDTLVSIGGGIDKLFGGPDGDSFWKDPADSTDADFGEIFFGGVHEVASFANGASIELEGQGIKDPDGYDLNNPLNPRDDYDPAWKSFVGQPLFGPAGIQFDDVRHGGVADGQLLSALAAVAGRQPLRIKQSIVDLGDGTFAVRFIAPDGAHRFYRIDAELPVKTDGTPYYAGLGNGGSLWTALMEKAFVLHNAGRNGTYHSLEAVNLRDAFAAFGLRAGDDIYTEVTSDTTVWNNGTQTMFDIKEALETGKLVTVRSTAAAIRNAPQLASNRLYIVEQVTMGRTFRSGHWYEKPVLLTLRELGGSAFTIDTVQIQQNLVSADAWQ